MDGINYVLLNTKTAVLIVFKSQMCRLNVGEGIVLKQRASEVFRIRQIAWLKRRCYTKRILIC